MSEMSKKVNPVHFKPTWVFVRMPDDVEEVRQVYGDSCLALSDAEMVCMKLALTTFVDFMSRSDNDRDRKISGVMSTVSEKLKVVLDIEFEDKVGDE